MIMKIYKLTSVTDHIVKTFETLIPQLAPHAPLPTKESLEAIVNSGSSIIFMAKADARVLGALTLVITKIPTGEKVWIEDVVVDKVARGKGAGKALVQFALDYAKSHGIKVINLTSSPDREAANKLYQSLGFIQRDTNVYRLTLS